ncbi:MAG: hypothetical protein AAF384_15620 [Pseudomonadota bacterium]
MVVTRLFTGDDGESHFEDIEVPLEDQGMIGRMSAREAVADIIFRTTGSDYDYDWHNAPEEQYIIILSGRVEIQVGDGTKRVFGPGDIISAEDTTGRGHISKAIDDEPRRSIFVTKNR